MFAGFPRFPGSVWKTKFPWNPEWTDGCKNQKRKKSHWISYTSQAVNVLVPFLETSIFRRGYLQNNQLACKWTLSPEIIIIHKSMATETRHLCWMVNHLKDTGSCQFWNIQRKAKTVEAAVNAVTMGPMVHLKSLHQSWLTCYLMNGIAGWGVWTLAVHGRLTRGMKPVPVSRTETDVPVCVPFQIWSYPSLAESTMVASDEIHAFQMLFCIKRDKW